MRSFAASHDLFTPAGPLTVAEAHRRRSIDGVVRTYRERLLAFIRWLAPSRSDAEDILQDVLLQFAVSYDDIVSLGDISAWLFRVARNRVTDLARKPSLGSQVEPSDEGEGYLLEELLPDLSNDPQRRFARAEAAAAIEAALDDLPQPQRDVFIWHELQGLNYAEMAGITGDPVTTLLSRKHYAVLALRAALNDLKTATI